jgi:hypothetical protein
MESQLFMTRQQLARRWNCGMRTIDRRRKSGLLPWVDLGCGSKPIVRICWTDVLRIEESAQRGRELVAIGDVVDRLVESPETVVAAARESVE